jgi:hypothetical protein
MLLNNAPVRLSVTTCLSPRFPLKYCLPEETQVPLLLQVNPFGHHTVLLSQSSHVAEMLEQTRGAQSEKKVHPGKCQKGTEFPI